MTSIEKSFEMADASCTKEHKSIFRNLSLHYDTYAKANDSAEFKSQVEDSTQRFPVEVSDVTVN